MHDQRKVREELDEFKRKQNEEKIHTFRTLYDKAFAEYRGNNLSREVLKVLDVLLEVNPEQYTFFGYRRRILLNSWKEAHKERELPSPSPNTPPAAEVSVEEKVHTPPPDETTAAATEHQTSSSSAAPPSNPISSLSAAAQKAQDLEHEFLLNTKVILKDFKVYSAFVHRRWIIETLDDDSKRLELLAGELKKCEGLLKMDERNFHAWGYRRWVSGKLRDAGKFTDSDERAFTEAKILQNFSNYSAWHNRALLIKKAASELLTAPSSSSCVTSLVKQCEEDLQMAIKAFYCDPNDQSAWLFSEYLLHTLRHLSQPSSPSELMCVALPAYESMLLSVAVCCNELKEEEQQEESTLPFVAWMQWTILTKHHHRGGEGDISSSFAEAIRGWRSCSELLTSLSKSDPLRSGMYGDVRVSS